MPIIAGRASAAYGAGFSRVVGTSYAGPFGAFEALSTVTVGATSVSSVSFDGIPANYKYLQIRYIAKSSRTAGNPLDELNLRFNGDATSGNYYQHGIFGDGSGTGNANAVASSTNIELGSGFIGDAISSSQFGIGIVDILDYASPFKATTIRMMGGVEFNGAPVYGGRAGMGSGYWANTNPVQSIQIYAENGNLTQYSSFALYGVK